MQSHLRMQKKGSIKHSRMMAEDARVPLLISFLFLKPPEVSMQPKHCPNPHPNELLRNKAGLGHKVPLEELCEQGGKQPAPPALLQAPVQTAGH